MKTIETIASESVARSGRHSLLAIVAAGFMSAGSMYMNGCGSDSGQSDNVNSTEDCKQKCLKEARDKYHIDECDRQECKRSCYEEEINIYNKYDDAVRTKKVAKCSNHCQRGG